MKSKRMIVCKFGGSSVQDAETIRKTAEIIAQKNTQYEYGPVVVLSAMGGVTDLLIKAAEEAENGREDANNLIIDVQNRHAAVVAELLSPGDVRSKIEKQMESIFYELTEILHGVSLLHECTGRTRDYIASFGERLNCLQIHAYLQEMGLNVSLVDSREMIRTEEQYGGASVLFAESNALIQQQLDGKAGIVVAPGFIAATKDGVTTTLGRNGSDYTASIIGAAVNAEAIEIWTDVDGVLSADPRVVPDAFFLPQISFREAMELSYFGAEVIHPYTMIPAMSADIPVYIKNTRNPAGEGTRISSESSAGNRMVTGLASIRDVALVNIEGGGMVGIPGFAGRVFTALAGADVNIIMITQASSEHSICIVIRSDQKEAALKALQLELEAELKTHQIEPFEVVSDLEIVAIIGENMRGTPGISGKLFSTLGDKGINVLAIAQGSSEMNVSFVIHGGERETVLRSLHHEFFGGEES